MDVKYKMYGDISEDTCNLLLETFTSDEFLEKLSDGHTYICNNVKHSDYSFLKNEHIFSFVARLILVDGRRAGVYVICDNEPDFFVQRETFFDNILSELQVGMNNAFLYMQFENLAKRDGLTGLYNRRILNKFMEKYRHADAELKKERVAAAMFDIDNFKMVNDTYGHEAGDRLIIAASQKICNVYLHSPVFRLGGDEFAAILSDRDYAARETLLQQFQENVELFILDDEKEIELSIASGMAVYPDDGEDYENVFRCADERMYQKKKQMKQEKK